MQSRMEQPSEQSLWGMLEGITENLKHKRLADVFRFVSFRPFETFGPHKHLRIEINYVKKGNCILHLENESISFSENEMMVICSNVEHTFEAGSEDTTLMQLEFLPEVFSRFNPDGHGQTKDLAPVTIFSEENRLIKIVNNVRIMRAVQRIVNEMNQKSKYYQYLVVMYYAELLILIYRYLDEAYLPICTNDSLKKAISYIRLNYQPISRSAMSRRKPESRTVLAQTVLPVPEPLPAGLPEPDPDQQSDRAAAEHGDVRQGSLLCLPVSSPPILLPYLQTTNGHLSAGSEK